MRLGVFFLCLVSAVVGRSVAAAEIRTDGATAGRALIQAAAREFSPGARQPTRIVLGTSGSGGGLRKLCGGEIDIASAARPIMSAESAACLRSSTAFVELPVAMDVLVLVVNVKNSFVSRLTVDEVRRIWGADAQGKVARWDQVNPRFPGVPLRLLGPDPRFERASIFTEAILGRGQRARGDFMTSADDLLLVQGVARDVHALTYLPRAIYLENQDKLRSVPVDTAAGNSVVLAQPLILYISAKSIERGEVREFVEFLLGNARRLVQDARAEPLADETYRLVRERFRTRVKDSAWGGTVPLDATPEAIHARQLRR